MANSNANATASQAPPERHTCHCGKGFIRKEHLRRHQATHGKRSYVCDICQRSFTRNDLLRRHTTLHNSAPVSTTRSWRACDACHANKTKCDGGEPCPLCVKRGLACTYDRNATRDGESDRSDPRTDSLSPSGLGASASSIARSANQSSILQTCCMNMDNNACCARACLASILKAVSLPSIEGLACSNPPAPENLRAWISQSVEQYFGPCHERWQLVHAPVFDERTDDAFVVGSVILIGSWHRDREGLGDFIIDIHSRLVYCLLTNIAAPAKELDEQEPWPYDVYQAALLNIIFAYETGIQRLIQTARRLLSSLIIALRDHGAFNPDIIGHHQNTYFPGDFVPWVHMGHAKWTWLAANMLKADVAIALFLNQPPLMEPEELELSIPCTFALANARGIHKFFRRHPKEPPGREGWPISHMACSVPGMLPPWLVMEDIQLGLCGLYRAIWKSAQMHHSSIYDSGQLQRQLDIWKCELDKISGLWGQPEANATAINYLLRVYSAKEEPDMDGWEKPVVHRIAAIFFNVTMLYHLLSLHLFAEIRLISLIKIGSGSLGQAFNSGLKDMEARSKMQKWASSFEGRSTVMHSIAALKAYEKAIVELSPGSIDPTAHATLSTAAVALRAWMSNTTDACNCGLNLVAATRNFDNEEEKKTWVQHGGHIAADNVPLCKCAEAAWTNRFMGVLLRTGREWDTCGFVARSLSQLREAPRLDVS